MTPRLVLVTTTEIVELPLNYIPQSLFSRVIETTMLRNQDDTKVFILTDELPVPHFFEFSAKMNFKTETEKYQYVEWLKSTIDDTDSIVYRYGTDGVRLPVSTGWLSYSIGTSNPIEMNVVMKFLPTNLEWEWELDDTVRMYRDDIPMSSTDITWETTTYPFLP